MPGPLLIAGALLAGSYINSQVGRRRGTAGRAHFVPATAPDAIERHSPEDRPQRDELGELERENVTMRS